MKNSKFSVTTILTTCSLFLLLGCQQNSKQEIPAVTATPLTPATVSVGKSTTVAIKNFAFDKSDLTITKGTKVKWTNNDSAPHTVTSDTGVVFASENLSQGQSFEFTFDKEGTYPYHCAVHPSMKGTITVTK